MKKDKTILVIDWLDVYGGAEKVAKYLHEEFKFDKVYTLVNIMTPENLLNVFGEEIEIETSHIQFFGKNFRYALALFPFALKRLKIKEEDALIISISHSVVKGIDFPKSCKHISYFVARNLKYVWGEKDLYFYGIRRMFRIFIPYLQNFDIIQSKKPTKIISVSTFVSDWTKEKYDREAITIYPPVSIDDFEFQKNKEDFYVSVGRLEPYKRYDILIDVFNNNGKKLIIIGDGSLFQELQEKAKDNIEFKGYLFPRKSKEYLKRAKAFVFCGKEDFGIALLESQVCGTPVISFGEGGALDSIIDNKTGVLFYEQTSESLDNAIEKFQKINFDASYIREHSLNFSIEKFKEKFNNEI
jgi:glycosyltransferase involved in cell wall biosynthesis